jgi:hypothetical protein
VGPDALVAAFDWERLFLTSSPVRWFFYHLCGAAEALASPYYLSDVHEAGPPEAAVSPRSNGRGIRSTFSPSSIDDSVFAWARATSFRTGRQLSSTAESNRYQDSALLTIRPESGTCR